MAKKPRQTLPVHPAAIEIGDQRLTLRWMCREDRSEAVRFTKALARADLTFLQMDITQPDAIDEWVENIESGRAWVLLARRPSGRIAGYASLYRNDLMWTHHHGEMRVFVTAPLRRKGLGREMALQMVNIAREQQLEKVVVNIPRGQQQVCEMLKKTGFAVEALLADWLMDFDGSTHDLIVMSYRIAA